MSHLEELNITPSEVVHWCDNEQSVRNTRERPYHASAMIASDADLVLAIHHLKSVLPYPVDCRHVYGHQDDNKRKAKREEKKRKQKEKQAKKAMLSPEPVQDLSAAEESVIELFSLRKPEEEPPEEEKKGVSGAPRVYPPEVQINMACDIMASDTSKAHLESGLNASKPLLTLPYTGSKAMLRLGNRWITSNYKGAIHRARRTKAVRDYCNDRHKWKEGTFEMVSWESIGTVRGNMGNTKKMQTCKIMHGWLPIMHMRQWITGVSQCPGCSCQDETMEHLFRCPHPTMKTTRAEAVK